MHTPHSDRLPLRKTSGTHHPVILLMEDDEGVQNIGVDILERAGYRVMPFTSPAEALRILTTSQPDVDLVITDLVMPEMHGVEFAKRVKTLLPNVRVLYISGYAEAEIHRQIRSNGDCCLQKPFRMATLLARVADALSDGE